MSEAAELLPPGAIPHGYRQDARGALIPVASIKPEHLLEDELALKLLAKAQELSAKLAEFKAQAFAEVDAYVDLLAQQYDTKIGGVRGNLTLTAFDGSAKVMVAIGDKIELGPELQVAKSLIDECIRGWSKDADDNLKAAVLDAFQVDKSGRLDTKRVLGLRRVAISDERWKRAMDAISNSVRVTHSKRYVRFYVPSGQAEAPMVQVPLDLASADAVEGAAK